MHNGWVTIGGEKMSKSMGNTALVHEVRRAGPRRSSFAITSPPRTTGRRSSSPTPRWTRPASPTGGSRASSPAPPSGSGADAAEPVLCAFTEALDDDLGTPAAVAVIHETVRQGNTALADGDDAAVAGALGSVRAMLGVLGLDPLDPRWATAGADERLTRVTGGLVSLALEQRQAARGRKDFAAADAIRDQLTSLGVFVEDTPQGPRWELTR